MVRAIRGVLITCDAPAKTIIERLHARRQDIIIEVLDETHVVIQESKLSEVKDEIRAIINKKEDEYLDLQNSESDAA